MVARKLQKSSHEKCQQITFIKSTLLFLLANINEYFCFTNNITQKFNMVLLEIKPSFYLATQPSGIRLCDRA